MADTTPLRTATAVRDSAEALAQAEWGEATGGELAAAASALARAQRMVDGAMVALAEQLETPRGDDALMAAGWASARDFLTHVTGGHKGAGGGLVRLAHQTADLPTLRQAQARGEVSADQARAIAGRVATLPRGWHRRDAVVDAMLDLVATRGHDATDLRRGFTSVVREIDADGDLAQDRDRELADRGAHGARHLSFSPDGLGGVRVSGYGTVEEAELVKSCLLPLAAPVTTEPGACGGDPSPPEAYDDCGRRVGRRCPDPTCRHDGRDPRDGGVRTWDALVEACRRLQATDSLPHDHGSSARVLVTVGHDALLADLSDAGLLPSGETLSASAVRRLACDAEIIPGVLGSDGQVLDVGRARRLVTTAIWFALLLRDRHCAFPGCDRLPHACDAHHVVHWSEGGPTSLDNLVLLCRRHHTLTHHSPWSVRIDPGTRRPIWTPPPRQPAPAGVVHVPARPPPAAA